jgi:hypothetical protein
MFKDIIKINYRTNFILINDGNRIIQDLISYLKNDFLVEISN